MNKHRWVNKKWSGECLCKWTVGLQRELTCCSASSSSLLIFRSSSSILHRDRGTRVTAAVTSCLLTLAHLFPLKDLPGKQINYTAEAELLVHDGEWGSGQWVKRSTDYQMFGLWNLESEARLFFHLETLCLTSADQQPRTPWKHTDVLGWDRNISGLWVGRWTCLSSHFACLLR